jgi:hypothetical protein
MLIGLCGPAGAGKNTVAELLPDVKVMAFADPLYSCISTITGLTVRQLQDRTTKETPIPWLGKSPRQLLQTLGTEWGRNSVHEEIWVNATMQRVAAYASQGISVCITDVRFDNEAQAVLEAGGEVWRVVRPGWRCLGEGEASHSSEAGVSDHLVTRIIDNSGSLDDLREQLAAATI